MAVSRHPAGTGRSKYSVSTLVVCGALLRPAALTLRWQRPWSRPSSPDLHPRSEVLQTMLLNNIKLKLPASRIVALDFNRGISIVEMQSGGLAAVNFDTTTLALK